MAKQSKPSKNELQAQITPIGQDDNPLDTLMNQPITATHNLLNPVPSFNNSTSLTHIELPRKPGEHLTDEERQHIQAVFLYEFSRQANVTRSCVTAGIDRTLVYYWLKHDVSFADGWAVAEEQANDTLRAEAFRRAVDGVSEPIVSMGKLVRDEDGSIATVTKYDTPLLMMLMRARMPEYRDTRNVEMNSRSQIDVHTSHQLTLDTRSMNAEELATLRMLAEGIKAREQARIEAGKEKIVDAGNG